MGLFLELEHLKAIVGLLIALIATLLCLREQGGLRRGREMEEWLVGKAMRTHNIYQLSSPSYMGMVSGTLTVTAVTVKITDHSSP